MSDHPKDPAAVSLGRRGGQARAAKMTKKQRSDSARKAITARWHREEHFTDALAQKLLNEQMRKR